MIVINLAIISINIRRFKMENKKEGRIFQYDLMRVLFMLMVLGVHVLSVSKQFSEKFNTTWIITTILTDIFLICNPLFFMLSGRFNLKKEFNTKEDYKKFYIKRVISLLIPFLIFSIVIYIYRNFNNLSIVDFAKGLLAGNIEGTYWFVYTLLGIMIFSPFFAKMLRNMNLFEKKLFFIISFCVNTFITVFAVFKVPNMITFNIVGLVHWNFYYLMGEYIEEIFSTRKSRKIIMLIGILAFILQFVLRCTIDTGYRLSDPSPLLTLQALALYFFVLEFVKIKNEKLKNIISYFSKYSYIFYLLHMTVINFVDNFFNMNISAGLNLVFAVCIFIISFALTMIISIIVDKIIIRPIQKILKTKFLVNS